MAARQDPRRAPMLIFGLLGLVLVILIGTIITLRVTGEVAQDRPSTAPTAPSPPVSGRSPDPHPSPGSQDTNPGCPDGEPDWTRRHPDDDRVHGGDLSFRPVRGAGFGRPRVVTEFSWWYDANGQSARSGSGRTAVVAVGAVAIKPGVYTPAEAARSSMLCLIGTDRFRRYPERDDVRGRKVLIDGQRGWELITDVRRSERSSAGLRIRVITVDAGPPGSISIFVGIAPIGDRARTRIVSAAVADLRCSAG